MKIIGGEPEISRNCLYEYITDSGRSSLRLILNKLKEKKFLLPNYLCEVILKIFDEFEINYSFYTINDDLSIDVEKITKKNYDVLYIINYFGHYHDIYDFVANDTILVEDNVFLPLFDKPNNINKWIGFNSFRKISLVADGSLIKSTIKLPDELILKEKAKFASIKYKAKEIKYAYLKENEYSEEEYLSLFKLAESKLDEQNTVNTISTHSLFRLLEFMVELEKEYSIRKENFDVLNSYLDKKAVKIKTKYPSFYVLSVDQRDELRQHLFSRKVYLPVHWPQINGVSNNLYNRLISIPVDSRYTQLDMTKIGQLINNFYGSNN